MILLIMYVVGILVTWIYAGYCTGKEFYRVSRSNPNQLVQVNWGNVFWQGITWLAVWASFIGKYVEKRWGKILPQQLNDDSRMIQKAE